MTDNFLNAKDFNFAPFSPRTENGDSGTLMFATSKSNPDLRYVVKNATPELACNEFMYHKIALSMGLNTPKVCLILGMPDRKQSAGIRYIPSAIKFEYDRSTSLPDLHAFQTLYIILNEEDSEEYYLDGAGEFFKLDNAASFNIESYTIPMFSDAGKNEMADTIIRRKLDFIEYDKYRIILGIITERYSDTGRQICVNTFERFAAINENRFEEAYAALDRVYPAALSEYYREFISLRKASCERFLREYKDGVYDT